MSLLGTKKNEDSVQARTWTIMGIVLFCLLVTGIFIYTFNITLLLVAGIVLAVYLRMIADKIKKWTGWKDMLCYGLSIIITLVILTGLGWMIGAKVQQQAKEMVQQLPEMKKQIGAAVDASPFVKRLVGKYTEGWSQGNKKDSATTKDQFNKASGDSSKNNLQQNPADSLGQQNKPAQQQTPEPSGSGGISSMLQKLFTSTFGLLGDLYVIFFLGIFLAGAPREYVNGMVRLLPASAQDKGRKTLEKMGLNLKKWFKGTVYSVLITFALTAIGLLIIGVDLWLILAIIAGLLTFIPNFGPIIALIPAVMVGFLQGPQMALWIFILYFFVQLVESNIITPAIQKKMLNTPAALLLFFQMIMGALSGGWGVVLATPVLVILMTVVKELYTGNKEQTVTEEKEKPEKAKK
ncbi:MAG: AI-2E family transporter [Chitinophagaceae bacterium]